MRLLYILFLLLFFSPSGESQTTILKKKGNSNRHRFYFFWGWNRGYFTDSDIHFSGNGYNFELKNVVAKDRQTPFAWNVYFHPEKITIPQTNYGFGYWLRDNYLLTFGVDHMKYVVQQNQTTTIDGSISIQNKYDGEYQNEPIVIQPDFLKMEHTDGLNYLTVGLNRTNNLLKTFSGLTGKLELIARAGAGVGVLIPRTDVTVLNQETRNKYHLSGFGISANAGLQIVLFKNYFISGNLKGGYINLNNILTSLDGSGKAKQDFYFLSPSFHFGGIFFLKKKT